MNKVPTEKWRSAMTVPRDLEIEKIGEKYLITSRPVKELTSIEHSSVSRQNVPASGRGVTEKIGKLAGPARLSLSSDKLEPFTITISNDAGEKVEIGYDNTANKYFIDRTKSGKIFFEKGFAARHTAPRFSTKNNMDLTLIIDDASVELFADNGLTVSTEIFFPNKPYSNLSIHSNNFKLKTLSYNKMKSIWK